MKLIKAIIRPNRLEEIRQALTDAGIEGMTVTEVHGFGRQKGHSEAYRGSEYTVDFLPKTSIEMVVPDAAVSKFIEVIIKVAHSGKIGDGKIFVTAVEEVTRIRTGEKNEAAL